MLKRHKDMEVVEMTNWYESCLQLLVQQSMGAMDQLLCKRKIITSLESHVEQYMTVTTMQTLVVPRVWIVGPNGSGKSTCLYMLCRIVLEKMLHVTNQWLCTFVVPGNQIRSSSKLFWLVNWQVVVSANDDTESFYCKYVHWVLHCLCQQRPALRSYCKHLQHYFDV